MARVVSAADLIGAINSALVTPVASHSTSTPSYDLYEVFLFGVCIQAAESIGMDVSFQDAFDRPVSELVLRTSPSTIWSSAQAFTHACLAKDGEVRLEVHLGIYMRGNSGVSHEGDVVVIDSHEAARARVLRTDPRVAHAAVMIEAKFYGSNVGLRTGREFLGLVTDVGGGPAIFVSSSPGNRVHRLLSYRHRSGHFELIPGSIQETELKGQIAMKLRDYLAQYS
jgi:hypothetical protein